MAVTACGALAFTMAAASPSQADTAAPFAPGTLTPGTLTQVATIPVLGAPTGLADDSATGTIYATGEGAEAVYAINAATSTLTATIPVGQGPTGLAVDPVTDTIYTASNKAGTVTVIDGATNTVTATIPAPGAGSIALNTATDTIYVNCGYNGIDEINGKTDTFVTKIGIRAKVHGIAIDQADDRLFTAGKPATYPVGEINARTGRVIATGIAPSAQNIAIDPQAKMIYVAGYHHTDEIVALSF